MFTYQIRRRVLRLNGATRLPFPAEGEVSFHFSPGQPFGEKSFRGRTATRRQPATAKFDANTGEHWIESKRPLRPLHLLIKLSNGALRIRGSKLTLTAQFRSSKDLTKIIESYYHVAPMLLALDLGDPPVISRVDGSIGGVPFRWELERWHAAFTITTRAKQHNAIVSCFDRMKALSAPGSHRLLASLHYFHVALRLTRRGEIAGEFLAEVILNLSKSLEVLFPPQGTGKTRDAVRRGLKSLGYTDTELERDFLPCMALRSEIDVAHADLSLYKLEQLTVIHGYVERCEFLFRRMFQRLMREYVAGRFKVQHHTPVPPNSATVRVIDRLRDTMREELQTSAAEPIPSKRARPSIHRCKARWRAFKQRVRRHSMERA